jgi:acetyl esterase/lipase
MSVRHSFSSLVICLSVASVSAQPTSIKLWPKGAPGGEANPTAEAIRLTPEGEHVLSNVQEPSITPYLPQPNASAGAAVIIAPGGGHSEIWIDHEGYDVAEWLSSHGVAAFVLKYRLARGKGSKYTVEGTELGDMQRAIRTVRSRSKEWRIDPARIGVMGFSAGGELAALSSTRYDNGLPSAADPVERFSSKPNFQALLYPAIPHDTRLTADTPPAFLACGGDDRPDISQGLPEFYLALTRIHVSAELHIYAGVGHGFGVRKSNSAAVSGWTLLFLEWLNKKGY